ncbi:MAG: hypothetical protein AB7O97_16080 [Planctomycetota bacterium]
MASERRPSAGRRLLGLVPLALLPACYASNVVAEQDRAVALQALPTEWRPAAAADLDGLFESIEIRGDAALSLRKVYYWFSADGVYTGAALVDGDDAVAFQTLNGEWLLDADGLRLDGGDAVPTMAAPVTGTPTHVRIDAEGGSLVLQRSAQ